MGKRKAKAGCYVIYIPAEGPVKVETEMAPFEDYQKYVGGYVQLVHGEINIDLLAITMFNCWDESLTGLTEIFADPKQVEWLVNEEGKLVNLPINPKATILMNLGYEIVGDVVLLVGHKLK